MLIETEGITVLEIDNYPKKYTAYELARRYTFNLTKVLFYMGQGTPVEPF